MSHGVMKSAPLRRIQRMSAKKMSMPVYATLRRGALVLGIGLAAVTPARADPALNYTVGVDVAHSNNLNLSHDDPIGANTLTPRLAFDYTEQGALLTATAAGSLGFTHYLGNAPYSDQFFGVFSGVADWAISPERFDWVAEDYVGRQPVNVLAANTQNNQQQTNVFSTGPTLRARFSDAWRGRLDLRYTNAWADKTREFNSNSPSAVAQMAYLLGANDSVSGNVTALNVRYKDRESQAFNYDRHDAYAGYQHTDRLFSFNGQAGYSWLSLRDKGQRTGPLLMATLNWTPSPTTSVGATVRRDFSDASHDLMIDPSDITRLGIGSARNGTVISPQLYIEKLAQLDFNHTQNRLRIDLAPFWRQIDYIEGENLSQHSLGYYANLSYLLNPTLVLSASSGRERRRYTGLDRVDTDIAYAVELVWQRTSHWFLSTRLDRILRNSTVVDARYTETIATLSLSYKR